jgi:hypothetical protein
MPDEKAQLLAKLLDAFYVAEFCAPQFKAEQELACNHLLEEASRMSGKSSSLIKEAVLKSRYPEYRRSRLQAELPSVPPKLRGN